LPRVSVIMPVWNREDYVLDAARSILAQSFGDLELVAVDDGSTDRSAAILEGLAATDPRLRVVRARHGGQAATLIRGMAEARAPRIAFQDSDDLWRPKLLELLSRALDAAAPRAVLAYGEFRFFRDGTDPADRRTWLPFRRRGSEGRVLPALVRHNFVARIGVLVERAALDGAGGVSDPAVGLASDWDLFLRLAALGEFARVREVVALVRLHGGNLSHDLLAHHRSFVAVLEAARARCRSPLEARRLGIPRALAWQRLSLARRLVLSGDPAAARALVRRALSDLGPLEAAIGAGLYAATLSRRLAEMLRALERARRGQPPFGETGGNRT
jgi:glycosyltransferase involved in cell wall biosynthesis